MKWEGRRDRSVRSVTSGRDESHDVMFVEGGKKRTLPAAAPFDPNFSTSILAAS